MKLRRVRREGQRPLAVAGFVRGVGRPRTGPRTPLGANPTAPAWWPELSCWVTTREDRAGVADDHLGADCGRPGPLETRTAVSHVPREGTAPGIPTKTAAWIGHSRSPSVQRAARGLETPALELAPLSETLCHGEAPPAARPPERQQATVGSRPVLRRGAHRAESGGPQPSLSGRRGLPYAVRGTSGGRGGGCRSWTHG